MKALTLAYKQLKNNYLRKMSVLTGTIRSKPLRVSIEPSKRCNARCIMCPSWHVKEDYLDSNEIIESIKQLKDWMGTDFYVSMAGGEALMYPGIFDIFQYCRKNGIYPMITTNAVCFSKTILDKIIDSGLSYIAVSLDSHIPDVHDKIRGRKGLFHKAVDGIYYLKEHGRMPIGVSTTLMSHNAPEFIQSVEYFLSLPIDRLLFQPIEIWDGKRDYGAWHKSDLWINDRELIRKISLELHKIKKRDKRFFNTEQDITDLEHYFSDPTQLFIVQKRKCTLGFEKIVIDYKGDIYLGCHAIKPTGNIKKENIVDVWMSKESAAMRKWMLSCDIPCTNNGLKQVSLLKKIRKFIVLSKGGFFAET